MTGPERVMTGPEFATAHGDSSTWTDVDFDTQLNLAEIDDYQTTHPQQTEPAPAA